MLNTMSRARLVGVWVATVVVIFACCVVEGAAMTTNAGELWVVACLVPPAVILLVWPKGVGRADRDVRVQS